MAFQRRNGSRLLQLLLIGAAAVGGSHITFADIRWRVSVKFILDAQGNRPTGNISTDDDVWDQVLRGNEALVRAARGHRLELVEIENVTGLESYHDTCDSHALEQVVVGDPSYLWRGDAINVYVTDGPRGGQCAFPGDHTIVLCANGTDTVLLHEIGHYFALCHTQGCPCESCDPDESGTCHDSPGDDGLTDTLPDLECWDQDGVCQHSFGVDYEDATPSQQIAVDGTFYNVMSYHDDLDRLTEMQMHRMSYYSNEVRYYVASGSVILVDRWAHDGGDGSFGNPFNRFSDGVEAAGGNDVVLVLGEMYAEAPLTISSPMTICAAWSPATIR
jgi:hypothetical protein